MNVADALVTQQYNDGDVIIRQVRACYFTANCL